MIIGTYFEGDNDDKLKMLQHGCYYDMLRNWITKGSSAGYDKEETIFVMMR